MIYGGEEVGTAQALLEEAGFSVSQVCRSRPSCFDFAGRKNRELVLIKVQSDVDKLSLSDSWELRHISESVSAASILIGEKTREKPLEDDTVYSRYNVLAVTAKTFEKMMVHKTHPLIQAGPGGYYVEIDGVAIRRRRQELGLSVGEMAKRVGLSRRTLYGYERGMAKASVTAAYNLVSTLGIPVAKTVNVFGRPRNQRRCALLTTARRMIAKNKLLTKIFRRIGHCNVTTVDKAPFDFVVNVPEERIRIIGGIADTKERCLEKRVEEILSVSRVVQAHPVLITEGQTLSKNDISCICSKELDKIRNAEDLIVNLK